MSEPEQIRILRVIARLNMGGPAIHVANLTAGLEERGYHTTLVAGSLARGEDSMAFLAERLGVSVVSEPEIQREISALHDARSVLRVAELIRSTRPHILHTHTAKAGAIARAAALLAGRARPAVVLHTFHGHVLKGYFGPGRTAFFLPAGRADTGPRLGRAHRRQPRGTRRSHRVRRCPPGEVRRRAAGHTTSRAARR